MEISAINDTVVATIQALGFQTGKLLLLRPHSYSPINIPVAWETRSPGKNSGRILAISAVILPVDAIAPPPVKSDSYKVSPCFLARRTKGAPRRLSLTGEGEKGSDDGSAGNNNDGPFGGGGGGNSFGRDQGLPWDDGSSSSSDPAFDFVYDAILWIALSNCLHFAFKKVVSDLGKKVVSNLGNVMEHFTHLTLRRFRVSPYALCD